MIVKVDEIFYNNLKEIATQKGYKRPAMVKDIFHLDFYDLGKMSRETTLFGFWGSKEDRLRYGIISYGYYLNYISDQREDKINRLLGD